MDVDQPKIAELIKLSETRLDRKETLASLFSKLQVTMEKLAGDEDSDEKSRTFLFYDEGHTLGNALRCVIAAYPEVTFCGYTVPHPSETKMNFRIQTNGPRALEILQRGLKDLEKMCDHTLEKFDDALLTYRTEQMST